MKYTSSLMSIQAMQAMCFFICSFFSITNHEFWRKVWEKKANNPDDGRM
jgi:hypothetical protein